MQLLQGATVYAGDRIRIFVGMTGKDPATGQMVPTPIPPDAIVRWAEGLMTPGNNLAFETATQRLDVVEGVGGPGEIVVLVDKAVAGQVRINFSCRDPRTGQEYNVTGQCKLTTAEGERPMANNPPKPSPTPGAVPQNVSFAMELVQPTKLPGK